MENLCPIFLVDNGVIEVWPIPLSESPGRFREKE